MASRAVARRTAAAIFRRSHAGITSVVSDVLVSSLSTSSRLSPNAALHPKLIERNVLQKQQLARFSEKVDSTNAEAPKSEEKPAEEAAASEEPDSPVDESAKRIEELEAQVKDLKDQLLRSLAEQDNTRRIAKRDVEEARQFAIKSFAKSILDVADNLERALGAVPNAMEKDKEAHPVLATLYEGIEMTEKGLIKTFEMNGLVKYGKAGEPFDPNKHDALFEYADPEKEPGTIGEIIKPGFMLNKRVLRPAEVGVIKKE